MLVTAATIAADTDEEAVRLAMPAALSWAEIRRGIRRPLRTAAEVEAYEWTPQERAMADERLRTSVIGSPRTVAAKLADLVEQTGADELMIAVQTHGLDERVQTLRHVAREWSRLGMNPTSDPADLVV